MSWFPIGPDFVYTPRDSAPPQRISRRNMYARQTQVWNIAVDPNDPNTLYTVDQDTNISPVVKGGAVGRRTAPVEKPRDQLTMPTIGRRAFKNSPDAVKAGGKLFEQHCAERHGATAAGTRLGPSLSRAQVPQAPAGAIFWVLSNGVVRHGMPDWSKLPAPERWQIVTFLKSLNALRGNVPPSPARVHITTRKHQAT